MDVGERHVRVSVGFRDFCVSVKGHSKHRSHFYLSKYLEMTFGI